MKTFTYIFFLLATMLTFQPKMHSQEKPKKPTDVRFNGQDIILDEHLCFKYIKSGNNFTITDLKNKEICKAVIYKNKNDVFESVISFTVVNKEFSNAKIVGRNDLIFRLVNDDVIQNDCTINLEKLRVFIEKNNELR